MIKPCNPSFATQRPYEAPGHLQVKKTSCKGVNIKWVIGRNSMLAGDN